MYKCKLKKVKVRENKNIFIIKSENDKKVVPYNFLEVLLNRLLIEYKIYNTNDWYFDYDKSSNWEEVKTENGILYFQKVEKYEMPKLDFSDEEIQESYLREQFEKENLSLEEYKEMHYISPYQTIFVSKTEIDFSENKYKKKEIFKILESKCIIKIDVKPDGDNILFITLLDVNEEGIINKCLIEYNEQ